MSKTVPAEVTCRICGKHGSAQEMIHGGAIRAGVVDEIRKDHPEWSADSYICRHDLDHYRAKYVESSLENEKGELSELDRMVLKSMKDQEILAKNPDREFDDKLTFGQKLADKVAVFGGSWNFIISFTVFLAAWMVVNSIALLRKPFDPFPFILLNLMLSGVAGLQAPVIMMSQNRQEAKDRLRAEHDYQVNLKAELEIRNLHEKIDHLLNQQWQRLLEIQQIQTDLIEELASASDDAKASKN